MGSFRDYYEGEMQRKYNTKASGGGTPSASYEAEGIKAENSFRDYYEGERARREAEKAEERARRKAEAERRRQEEEAEERRRLPLKGVGITLLQEAQKKQAEAEEKRLKLPLKGTGLAILNETYKQRKAIETELRSRKYPLKSQDGTYFGDVSYDAMKAIQRGKIDEYLSADMDETNAIRGFKTWAERKARKERISSNPVFERYGIDPLYFNRSALDKWAKKHNMGWNYQTDEELLLPMKEGDFLGFGGKTLASEQEIHDAQALHEFVKNKERKKAAGEDFGGWQAGIYSFIDASSFGLLSSDMYKDAEKGLYDYYGLPKEDFVSTSESMAKTLNENKLASFGGNVAGILLPTGLVSKGAQVALGTIDGFGKLAPWVQNAIADAITFGSMGGTRAAVAGGDAGDIAAETFRGALGGAAGSFASSATETGLTKLFTSPKVAGKWWTRAKDNVSTYYAKNVIAGLADSGGEYVGDTIAALVTGRETMSKEELLGDMAVAFIFGTVRNARTSKETSTKSRAVLENEFIKYADDYKALDAAAKKARSAEGFTEIGEALIQRGEALKQTLESTMFPGQKDAVKNMSEWIDAANDGIRKKISEVTGEAPKGTTSEAGVVKTSPVVTEADVGTYNSGVAEVARPAEVEAFPEKRADAENGTKIPRSESPISELQREFYRRKLEGDKGSYNDYMEKKLDDRLRTVALADVEENGRTAFDAVLSDPTVAEADAFVLAYNESRFGDKPDAEQRTQVEALAPEVRTAAVEAGKADVEIATAKVGEEKTPAMEIEIAPIREEQSPSPTDEVEIVKGITPGIVKSDYSGKIGNKTLRALDAIGKKLGVEITIGEPTGKDGENGKYKNGRITIAQDAENPLAVVLSHEVTHHMKRTAPAEYAKFVEMAIENSERRSGLEKAELIERYRTEYSEGKEFSDTKAIDEITADYAGKLVNDVSLFKKLVNADKNLAQRFIESIKRFIAKVKSVFSFDKSKMDTAAQEKYGTTVEGLEKAVKKYEQMLDVTADSVKSGTIEKTAGRDADGVEYSVKENAKGKYVQADRQVIFGNDPESWSEQLEDYINGKIRKGKNVELIAEDGEVLTLTEDTAGKVSSMFNNDGTTMSEEAFERKVNAGSHIDELAQVSVGDGKENVPDIEARHGAKASDGWNYRTAYFRDFDGKYYECRISVMAGEDGNAVYNIGQMRERSFPKNVGSSAANSGAQVRKTSFNDSIPDSSEKSNTEYSRKTGDLLSRDYKPSPEKRADDIRPYIENGAEEGLYFEDTGLDETHKQKSSPYDISKAPAEFLKAVDDELVSFVEKVENNAEDTPNSYTFGKTTDRLNGDIKELTGIDTTEYEHSIRKNSIKHILKRHGKEGRADHTMANNEDIARIGYVLDNYDGIELIDDVSAEFRDKNQKPAPMVRLSKKVDGTFYVVEAVPDTKAKRLAVVSAYIKKPSQQTRDVQAPLSDVRNASADNGSMDSISEKVPNVNQKGSGKVGSKKTKDGMKVSKVRTNTIQNSGIFSEEELQNPELSEENFKYKAISEDETQRRARERVSEGREEALEYIKNKEDWDGTDTDTAFELLRLERAEAAEKGDWVRVGEIARLIQKRATKAGQEIQAHAKYTRTAEKVIVEAAEQIENSSLISKEDIELLRELANRFVNDEGELDAARMDKVMTEILKEEPKVRRRRVRKVFRELIAARKKDMGKRDFLMETEEILSSHMEDTVKAQEIMKTVSGAADLIYSIKEDGEAAKDKLIELIKRQAAIRGHKISRANEKRILGEDFEFLYETAEKQLRAITEDYIPRLLGQKVSTVQSLGQLLQLPTYQTNIISNRAFGFADKQTANAFGIAFDRIISLITKQKTVRYENTFGHGISKAGEKAKNRAKINAALDIKSGEQGRYGTGTTRTFKSDESRWKVTKLLSNAEKLLAYELNVPDEAQKGRIKRAVTESLIPLVENGHMTVEEATEIAADEARYRTFQDDNLPSKILGELKKVFNHFFGTKDFGAGDFVCKYTQVAGALIERTLEYSPAGYLKGIYNLGEMWRNGISPKKQRKAALAFGRGTTGTGLILISTLLSSLGIVFRDDDESDDNIRALNSAEGVIGTKINLSALGRLLSGKSTKAEKGDTLLSIDRFEPFNMFFTVGAEISKAENKSFGNIALTSITGAAKSIGDLSVMQTIDEFISLLEYSDNADQIDVASEIAIFIGESTIGSFIPSLVRRGARAFDNNYRDAYADDSELGIALRQLGSSIPGVRNTLPKKLDNFGYEKTYTDNTVMNALNALALPFEVSAYKKRDVSSELERVRKETGNTNIYPPKSAPYSIKYDGEKYVLHTEARERYQKTRGNTMYRLIFEALKNENYKELNAEQQAAILEDFKAYATDKAKEEYFKSVSVEYESDSAVYKADEALLEGTKISDFYIGKYAEDKEEKTKEEAREKARRTAIEERYGALTDEGWKNIKRAMASSQKKDEEIAAIQKLGYKYSVSVNIRKIFKETE